ncbi:MULTISPECIES: phage tail tube protein [Haloferacaceae]|uniref:Phage tail tube protein n=1 Tax=Halorubrum glutamatedens TaxID=2707018 RepID=A0ABD5QU86_9EURY|nr:phage tail tube protein [Halobellus captivus]
MTGGSNVDVAFVHEPVGDYAGSPDDTQYKTPGRNGEITTQEFDNDETRQRNWGNETEETVEGTFEGAFSLSFDLVDPWFLNHVFGAPPTAGGEAEAPYSYTWEIVNGEMQSSRWYLGADLINGFAERQLEGVVFSEMEVNISIGDPVSVSLTGFYGSETPNTSFTPGSQPKTDGTPLIFHGGSINIPTSTEIVRPKSGTLSISNGARPQREWAREPVAAVTGNINPTLNLESIVLDTDLLELGLGSADGPATSVDGAADGELAFESPGANALRFPMEGITHSTYAWNNIGNAGEDLTDDNALTIDRLTAVAETASAEAQ